MPVTAWVEDEAGHALRVPTGNLRTSRLAIASLVLGILSLPSVGITGIPGLICGLLAQSKIRKNPTELRRLVSNRTHPPHPWH